MTLTSSLLLYSQGFLLQALAVFFACSSPSPCIRHYGWPWPWHSAGELRSQPPGTGLDKYPHHQQQQLRESSFSSPSPFWRDRVKRWSHREQPLCTQGMFALRFKGSRLWFQTSDKMGWDRSLHSHKQVEYLHFVFEAPCFEYLIEHTLSTLWDL